MMDLSLCNSLPLAVANTWLVPLWIVGLGVLAALAVLAVVYALLRWTAPKVAAITWTTGKEAISQPLFSMLLVFGTCLLVLFLFLPYQTFGEDIKMVKSTGLTLIMLLAVVLALWTASTGIADELEGRTALTVLSKPIGRRQFIVGKFLGVLGPVVILFIVLGGVVPLQHFVQGGLRRPGNVVARSELAGLLRRDGEDYAGAGAGLFAGRGDGVDQRGHLHPLADAAQPRHLRVDLLPRPPGADVGQLGGGATGRGCLHRRLAVDDLACAWITSTATAPFSREKRSPAMYLLAATVYCVLYSAVAMLLALLMFEDRDLA